MRFLFLYFPALIAAYDNSKMLCLVNQQRAASGLAPLGLDSRLTASAQQHSQEQADMNSMTHDGPNGSQPGDRVQSAGYQWTTVAENIAYGYGDEEECMKEWMQSPGHRENILGPYTHFGSAVAYAGSTPYYTQDFASGEQADSSYPECPSGDGATSGGEAPTGGSAPKGKTSPMGTAAPSGGDEGNDSEGGDGNYEGGDETPSGGAAPSGDMSQPTQGHGRGHGRGRRSQQPQSYQQPQPMQSNDNDNDMDNDKHGHGHGGRHGHHGGQQQQYGGQQPAQDQDHGHGEHHGQQQHYGGQPQQQYGHGIGQQAHHSSRGNRGRY